MSTSKIPAHCEMTGCGQQAVITDLEMMLWVCASCRRDLQWAQARLHGTPGIRGCAAVIKNRAGGLT